MVVYGAKRVQNQNFSSKLTLYYVWRVELFCAPQSAFDISPLPSPPSREPTVVFTFQHA